VVFRRCRAGCNSWRTLEWILPHPPPFHTFEEQPIIKETVGSATVTPCVQKSEIKLDSDRFDQPRHGHAPAPPTGPSLHPSSHREADRGLAAVWHRRPPNYNPAADDPMEHSYHPGTASEPMPLYDWPLCRTVSPVLSSPSPCLLTLTLALNGPKYSKYLHDVSLFARAGVHQTL
jgi:hypothetical protein